MKKIIVALLLISTFVFSACTNAQNSDAKEITSDNCISKTATADEANHDPYSVENRYDISDSYFEKKSGVDYGTVLKDINYYSSRFTLTGGAECRLTV